MENKETNYLNDEQNALIEEIKQSVGVFEVRRDTFAREMKNGLGEDIRKSIGVQDIKKESKIKTFFKKIFSIYD